MPDENSFTLRQIDQTRTDFAAIECDLEFIMIRLQKMPSRLDLAHRVIAAMVGAAGLVILWIELIWRHCP